MSRAQVVLRVVKAARSTACSRDWWQSEARQGQWQDWRQRARSLDSCPDGCSRGRRGEGAETQTAGTGARRLGRTEMQSETAMSSAAPGNPVAQNRAVPRSRAAGAAHSSSSVGRYECEQRGQRNYGAGAAVDEHGRQRWLRLNLNAGGTVGAGVCVSASVSVRVSVCAARGGRAAGALGSQRGQAARARARARATSDAATATAGGGSGRQVEEGGRGNGCGVSVASSGTLVAGL